jgi:phosphonate transport system ATP-binding protein
MALTHGTVSIQSCPNWPTCPLSTAEPIITVRAGSKSFRAGSLALNNVNLSIARGECVALLGASGSGKSTLLRALCGLETFSNSESLVEIQSQVLQRGGRLSSQVRQLRGKTAIIFQQFNLVGRKSLLDNALAGALSHMPLWRVLTARFTRAERKQALQALAAVGLLEYHAQRASTLSGGQQQRAAIARALVQGSEILLADEPVASLDPESTERVMTQLQRMNRERSLTLVISLHDVDLARRYCPRVVALKNGQLVYDGPSANLTETRLIDLYGPQAAAALHWFSEPPPAAAGAVHRL